MFRQIMFTCALLALHGCIDKSRGSADVRPAVACPEAGAAIDLCPDLQVKLLATAFHQAIGREPGVAAEPGHVFCLVELEWPKLPAGQIRQLPTLVDGSGRSWPLHAPAEVAWRSMQPDLATPDVRPSVAAGDRETLIFDLAASAAATGLQLHFTAPCEEPPESTYFCLGKHLIVME